jgi:hypothetical protein
MNRVATTEHLNVFDSGMFPAFDMDSGDVVRGPDDGECLRRMYVGFQRDMPSLEADENYRAPAVIALFTVWYSRSGTPQHFLEWLETSRHYDDDDLAQTLRDEFMAAVEEQRGKIATDPEKQEREDGTAYYLDTLDGAWECQLEGS